MSERLSILFVEDNDDHAELAMRGFAEHLLANDVRRVSDGAQALDYLLRRHDYAPPASSPRPNLILLDLRLPKVDGLEVLETIKSHEQLKRIPVVVLTTSDADADIGRAYDLHANAYLVKPVEFDEFHSLTRDLGSFWLAWNKPSAS